MSARVIIGDCSTCKYQSHKAYCCTHDCSDCEINKVVDGEKYTCVCLQNTDKDYCEYYVQDLKYTRILPIEQLEKVARSYRAPSFANACLFAGRKVRVLEHDFNDNTARVQVFGIGIYWIYEGYIEEVCE